MFQTKQEEFWAGAFGTDYIARNRDAALLAANLALFSDVLRRTEGVGSMLELGANIGMNLRALRQLRPEARLVGVEINRDAARELAAIEGVEAIEGSLFESEIAGPFDMVFTKGVLIHLAPERLAEAYARMCALSSRYVMICEYYNPAPVAIPYRGHRDRLFKRDFAGEMMDAHGLRLLDYGFRYRRDPNFPQDDLTWFLMEKF